MAKLHTIKRYLIAGIFILSLVITAAFLIHTGAPVMNLQPISGDNALTESATPPAPVTPQADYEYVITGSGNSLNVIRTGVGGNEIASGTVANITAALDAQNATSVTKVTFGNGTDTVDIGMNTFTVKKGTYIFEGRLTGSNYSHRFIDSYGVIHVDDPASAYFNGYFTNTNKVTTVLDNGNIFDVNTATLCCDTKSSFNIMGGTIEGMVWVNMADSQVNMAAGEIISDSHGMYMYSRSTFNMFGGTVTAIPEPEEPVEPVEPTNPDDPPIVEPPKVSYNCAIYSFGSNFTLNLYGGTIKSEERTSHAVRLYGSSANMYGGLVESKNANAFNGTSGTVNLHGGTVKTSSSANVIELASGTVNMYGGEVLASGTNSRGINYTTGTANISGGTISSNYIAINLTGGTLNISGGTVSGASRAVLVSTGTVNINGGTLSADGGMAIYVSSSGKVNIRQGEGKTTLITSANTTDGDGTISFYAASAELTIYGGTIRNTATGGAIIANAAGATVYLGITWHGYDNIIYDKTPKTVTASFEGVIGTETFTVSASVTGEAISVGNHSATATISGATVSGYSVKDSTFVFQIKPRPIEAIWHGLDDLYFDDLPKNVYASLNQEDILSGETVQIVNEGGGQETNVGKHSATASLTGEHAGNYTLTNAVLEYTITFQPIEIIWGSHDFTYDGKEKTVTADVSGIRSEHTVTVTLEGNKATDAGTYTAVVILGGADAFRYEASNPTLTYEIKPKELDSVWNGWENLIYNKNAKNVYIQILGGFIGDDTSDVSVEGGTETNAGTYTATATLSNSNYTLGDNETKVYTIAAIELGVTWKGWQDLTYTKTAKNVTAELNKANLLSGETADILRIDGGKESNAGTHTATAVLDNTNYTLGDNATREYVISPITVTVGWSGINTRTYNGKASNVTATAGGVLAGDTLTLKVEGGNETTAATHTAQITGFIQNTPNYVLPTAGLTQTYTISKLVVEFTWQDVSNLVYNGNPHSVTATVTNAITGDDVIITVNNGTNTAAGDYVATATLTGAAADNYALPTIGITLEYSIAKRDVSLEWDGYFTRVYDGLPSNVTVIIYGILAGDDVTPAMDNSTQKAAGSYTAKVTGLNGDQAQNYNLPKTGLSHEYSISQKEVGISWNNHTGLTYDGNNKNVSATATGVVDGDSVTVTVTNGTSGAVGNYTATATALGGADAANYKLPQDGLTQSYSITKVAGGSAPSVELESKTATSITIKAVSGAEYSKDGQTWQDTNTFSNLTAETAYTVYCRIKATDTTDSSAIGQANITTDSAKKGGCGSITLNSNIWWLTLITTFTALCAAMLIFKKKPIKN